MFVMMREKSTALSNLQATLKWTPNESSSFNGGMNENDLAAKIGKAIRTARKQRGFVMREVAEAAGVSTGAVGNWERGANVLSMENLQAVARLLGIDPVALSRGDLAYHDAGPHELADVEIISEPGPPPTGPLDVEILGVAVGGDDGDFTLNGEVSGYVRRPPGIMNVRNVFALHVLSDSMIPRYEPGDLIYCGGRHAVPGDDIVIEMYPDDEQSAGKAYVKRLTKRTAAELTCLQYNPRTELNFDAYRVKNMWRVIPLRELLGY